MGSGVRASLDKEGLFPGVRGVKGDEPRCRGLAALDLSNAWKRPAPESARGVAGGSASDTRLDTIAVPGFARALPSLSITPARPGRRLGRHRVENP